MQQERAADLILMIQCLDHIGLSIRKHILGSPVTPRNLAIVMDIITQAPTRQSDTQQMYQQQLSLLGFR